MNIRRGFLALAAMILGVGFLGAFPQQAHAACTPAFFPTTQQPTSSFSTWPQNGFMYYCGASNAQASNVRNAASETAGSLISTPAPQPRTRKLFTDAGVRVYKFDSIADANTYFGITIPAGSLGYTIAAGESSVVPGISVVVFKRADGDLTALTRTTNYQTARAFDLYWGEPSLNLASDFHTVLRSEIVDFNAKTEFQVFGTNISPTCQALSDNWVKLRCEHPVYDADDTAFFSSALAADTPGIGPDALLSSRIGSHFPKVRQYLRDLRDLSGVSTAPSDVYATNGLRVRTVNVPIGYATEWTQDFGPIGTPLKNQYTAAAAAGWKIIIANTPDDFHNSPYWPNTPDYNTAWTNGGIQSHPAFTEETEKLQVFFVTYYPGFPNLTPVLASTSHDLPGTIGHEGNHINDSLRGEPSKNDAGFNTAYQTGKTRVANGVANGTPGATVMRDFFVTPGDDYSKSELFAEFGAMLDAGHISPIMGYTYNDLHTWFPEVETYFNNQRALGNW